MPTFSESEYSDASSEYDYSYAVRMEEAPTTAKFNNKQAPQFNGETSFFEYEETVRNWCDSTTISDEKIGANLRNGLVGNAKIHGDAMDRNR